MLELRNVGHRYGTVKGLENIDWRVEKGDFVCFLGPNGAGKSTLLRVASGLLQPTSGSVWWGAEELSRVPRRMMAQRLAYVPQKTPLDFPYSVREVVMMGRAPHQNLLGWPGADDRRIVDEVLVSLDLEPLAERSVTALSGGEVQRVVLASAVAQGAQLLMLDEPTAHLDPHYALTVLETLARLNRERGTTVVLTLHDVNLAALFARRLTLLHAGGIAFDGPPRDVLTVDTMRQVFGIPVHVFPHPGRQPRR